MTPYPLIQAKWFTMVPEFQPRKIRLIVLHDMEAPETAHTAEDIARYFQTLNEKNADGSQRKASAHLCIDSDSIVQCVRDRDVAYAAPGANHDGLQAELAGYGAQTEHEWLDFYGVGLLSFAAWAVSDWCIKHTIPNRRLTVSQVRDGVTKGICGHADVTNAFHKSDHTDPGSGFPWRWFLESEVAQFLKDRRAA